MATNFDPDALYTFTDKDGNTFTASGRDPLVKEAMTKELPISINEQGEWYIYPYIERNGNGTIAHIPDWFEESEEYLEWQGVWVPMISNVEVNDHTVSAMNDVLTRLSKKAADRRVAASNVEEVAGSTDATTHTTQQSTQLFGLPVELISAMSPAIDFIALVLALVAAIMFNAMVKEKIRDRKKFTGIGWGLVNGIAGAGLLFVAIAHNSINKEIVKVRSKKYKEYAIGEMRKFIVTYFICIAIWIVILVTINVNLAP